MQIQHVDQPPAEAKRALAAFKPNNKKYVGVIEKKSSHIKIFPMHSSLVRINASIGDILVFFITVAFIDRFNRRTK
jgi:hypothetical protein